jgi:hypothetical protein
MGEGWGEGVYNIISTSYVPLPLPPPVSPNKWGRGNREKVIVALPLGEGKSDFL